MNIAIDVSVANKSEYHEWLDRILHTVDDGWHLWDVSDPAAFESSSWVTARGTKGDSLMELCRVSVRKLAYGTEPHRRNVRVCDAPTAPNDLRPEEAARLAAERMVILVENRNSDGAFLTRIIKETRKPLSKLLDESIRFDSVGGKGEMLTQVEKEASRRVRPRYVVVVDSDRRGPNEQPSVEAQRLERKCAELDVPCWILAKREGENYLPRCLLEMRSNSGAGYQQRVESWDALTEDQKDFFDMKHGLSGAPKPSEEDLYRGLDAEDRKTLQYGFGDHVWKCWDEWKGQHLRGELQDRGGGDIEHGLDLLQSEV